ncbi:MAG: threonine/serine dehydratase [Pyrinomonadaceae bacterium]
MLDSRKIDNSFEPGALVIKTALAEKRSSVPFYESSEIEKTASRLRPFIRRTPVFHDEVLSRRFNTNIYLKLELLQKTGAFKVRGAFNKMLSLSPAQREKGVVAVSGGNHAQAVAYAAKILGSKALILMPEFTPESYLAETRRLGAEVLLFPNLEEAFARVREFENRGYENIHPFDDPEIIAGQGTIGLEILEDVPDVTDVVVSVGGGGLSTGIAAVLKNRKPDVRVWGVETKGADSMARALEAGMVITLPEITSVAKTLGAQRVGNLCFDLARKYLSGVTVVGDKEAVDEVFYLLDRAKVLTEPAASCTVAAASKLRGNFSPASNVVLILCGGNMSIDELDKLHKKFR